MASRGGWPSSAFTSLLQSSQMPADAVGRAARRCIRSDGRCIDGHTVLCARDQYDTAVEAQAVRAEGRGDHTAHEVGGTGAVAR